MSEYSSPFDQYPVDEYPIDEYPLDQYPDPVDQHPRDRHPLADSTRPDLMGARCYHVLRASHQGYAFPSGISTMWLCGDGNGENKWWDAEGNDITTKVYEAYREYQKAYCPSEPMQISDAKNTDGDGFITIPVEEYQAMQDSLEKYKARILELEGQIHAMFQGRIGFRF